MRSLRLAALAGGLMLAWFTVSPSAASTPRAARPAGPAAWQAGPSPLPDDSTLHWRAAAPPVTMRVSHPVRLNECASVTGARTWRQLAYTGAGGLPGERDVFTFTLAHRARSAYQAIGRGMAGCQATTRALQARSHLRADAVVRRTASTRSSAAWSRRWTGVAGISAPGPQVNHLYVAWHGDQVSDVMFTQIATAPVKTAPVKTASGRQDMAARRRSTTRALTAGGPITRAEVMQRAQSWVNEDVPYNEAGYWADANGTYREDCSGYVSMAWDLTTSMVTWTLPDVSTLIPRSSLEPGDILDYTVEHVFIFAGWTGDSGNFNYYAESNPSDPTHGPTSANIDSAQMEGWPNSDYSAYQYDNLATSPPPAVTPAPTAPVTPAPSATPPPAPTT